MTAERCVGAERQVHLRQPMPSQASPQGEEKDKVKKPVLPTNPALTLGASTEVGSGRRAETDWGWWFSLLAFCALVFF